MEAPFSTSSPQRGTGGPSSQEPEPLPATESEAAAPLELDLLPAAEIARLMAREERRSVEAVERAADAVGRAASLVAAALGRGGRVFFVGAGTSGRLGAIEAAECPPTFGCPPEAVRAILAGGRAALERAIEGAEDRGADAAAALEAEGVGPRDALVAIAASGRTPFVRAALEWARRRGVAAAFLTCDAAVADERPAPADVVVALEVGPEVLAGSTRLKAGTATKIALNAITTAAFASLGAVYRNLMVDLRATNRKLAGRARRIVRRLGAAADEADAARALEASGGRVKEAVVMRRRGVGLEEARRILEQARGRLRIALGEAGEEMRKGLLGGTDGAAGS
jgi:N-acetylmuramic acid 6-phosphate etherase